MKEVKKFGIHIALVFITAFLGLIAFSSAMEPIIYYAYEGPIFPLTAVSDSSGITVDRDVKLDFSSYENTVPGETMVPFNESRKVCVSDTYVLTNATTEDIILEAAYPFVYTLAEKKEWIPEINIDGASISPHMVMGAPVTEQFEKYIVEDEKAAFSLAGKLNIAAFERIVSDDAYFIEALEKTPAASDTVIVYKFKNLGYNGTNKNATAPNLKVRYVQNENVEVLPANWDFCGNEEIDGVRKQMLGFDLPKPGNEGYGRNGYLVILNGDISDLTMQYYTSSTGSFLTDVEIDVERYETTLAEVAQEIFQADYKSKYREASEQFSEAQLFSVFLKGVCNSRDRLLNQQVDGDSIDNAWYYLYDSQRILYAIFDVTIPAGGHVTVQASYEKQASHGVYETDEHLDRYDILSEKFSTLEIISTKATATESKKYSSVQNENGAISFLHP